MKTKFIVRPLTLVMASFGLMATLFIINHGHAEAATYNVTPSSDCTLADAITAASTNAVTNDCAAGSEDDVINLAAGTYTLSNNLPSFNGSGKLAITGAGSDSTIIDGAATYYGFAAYNSEEATEDIFITGLTVKNTANGQAIYLSGINCGLTDVVVEDTTESNLNLDCTATVLIDEVRIRNLEGPSSGLLRVTGNNTLIATINKLQIQNNEIGNSDKASLHLDNILNATVENSEISGTTCTDSNCIFGGVTIQGEVGESYTIRNTTISDNTGWVGGLLIMAPSTVNLENVTITDNTGLSGGPFSAGGLAVLSETEHHTSMANVILDNNTLAGNASNCFIGVIEGLGEASAPSSLGGNISSDNTCSVALTEDTDQNSTDPLLEALASNGGFVHTHALPVNSPAINAGVTLGSVTTDARGVARPQCEAYDSGAYEFNGDCPEGNEDPDPDPGEDSGDTEKTFNDAVTSKPVTLITPAGTAIVNASSVNPKTLSADTRKTYPFGLVSFTMTAPVGSTQTVSLTFITDLKPDQVTARKYNAIISTYGDVPGASITEADVSGQHALTLTYSITDGGELDQDGVANGTIVDPVGLAVNQTGTLAKTGRAIVIIMVGGAVLVVGALVSSMLSHRPKKVRYHLLG